MVLRYHIFLEGRELHTYGVSIITPDRTATIWGRPATRHHLYIISSCLGRAGFILNIKGLRSGRGMTWGSAGSRSAI
ncbi:hypothetical protein M406DRAFT_103747 [Cryphonectria parasitica EP155]|uniref:Uncharacterized protein n=1 Tax=Cryphonectria parasitica (strain ATCC 38755 / EP155) TaxID=660469 RepID=A0A9P5CMW1_CRYP1|nr:uncharacterized protein M406DRAFT_103747 [Cryphonectria parasitica EP155]KAF3763295.1 hypothetical protein M406DRAFT_103747 [Cryphonectria parasitica EP155]